MVPPPRVLNLRPPRTSDVDLQVGNLSLVFTNFELAPENVVTGYML